ncbi:MAG: oligosaccharide flippase family protein [Deltaproteobacteria bacterium]|nr:oligosaccharide flippase family protein [Deltaproteobacteria bacterium]
MKAGKGLKDTVGILGTRVIWSVTGLISGVILARWLGPIDRGVLAIVLLIPSTVLTLVKLGVSQATVYFINRKEATVDRVASNSIILALGLGLLSAVVVWALRDSLLHTVLRDVPTWALLLALLRVPMLLLDNYLYSILQATGQFGMYNRRLLQSEALRLVLVVVCVMVLHLGLPAAVVIYTVIAAVNILWLLYSMSQTITFSFALDRALLGRMLSFGIRSYVQVVTAHLLLRIDVYMVQAFLGPAQTAFYALALHFTELVLEVPQAIGLVLYPKLAALPEERIHQLTAQTCRRTLFVTIPAAAALAFVGPWVITLWYGQPYAPAGAPLPWAAVGVGMMSIFVIITRDFTARGKQRVNTTAGLLALATNVALNVYLIPRQGIVGASLATAVAYTAACVVLMFAFVKESGLGWTTLFLPTRDDVEYFGGIARKALARSGRLLGC